jgi:hypothetical protein
MKYVINIMIKAISEKVNPITLHIVISLSLKKIFKAVINTFTSNAKATANMYLLLCGFIELPPEQNINFLRNGRQIAAPTTRFL